MRQMILVILVSLVIHGEVAAQHYIDGNKLYSWLLTRKQMMSDPSPRNINEFSDGLFATGYIVGVADGFIASKPKLFCVSGVNAEQLTGVTLQYLDAHPDTRHFNAARLIADALGEKFPCAKGGSLGK